MDFIQITEIPDGEAPDWVRKEWVGCIVPVTMEDIFPVQGVVSSTFSGVMEGYLVSVEPAIQALEALGKEEAAAWWREHSLSPPYFVFEKADCKETPPD